MSLASIVKKLFPNRVAKARETDPAGKKAIAWPPERSFTAIFIFNPSGESTQSTSVIRKYAEGAILRCVSKVLGANSVLDVLQPRLFGVSGPLKRGVFGIIGPTSVDVMERLLNKEDKRIQLLGLRYQPGMFRHFSFDSYIVCLMPLRKEQIVQVHSELQSAETQHYAGTVVANTSPEQAVALTASLHLGVWEPITSDGIRTGVI